MRYGVGNARAGQLALGTQALAGQSRLDRASDRQSFHRLSAVADVQLFLVGSTRDGLRRFLSCCPHRQRERGRAATPNVL